MPLLRKFYDNFEAYVCVFLVALMILCLTTQVFVRMTMGSSIAWAEELSRFCFIWTVYIGSSLAAKRTAHVRVTAQFILAPVKVRIFFRMLADTVWMAFNLFAAYHCAGFIANALQYPEVSPTLQWTTAYIELVIPVSFVCMTWRTLEVYITHWRKNTLYKLVSFEAEVGVA